MIVDASSSCHIANFGIGSTTGTDRQWDIKVTQYACGQETISGNFFDWKLYEEENNHFFPN